MDYVYLFLKLIALGVVVACCVAPIVVCCCGIGTAAGAGFALKRVSTFSLANFFTKIVGPFNGKNSQKVVSEKLEEISDKSMDNFDLAERNEELIIENKQELDNAAKEWSNYRGMSNLLCRDTKQKIMEFKEEVHSEKCASQIKENHEKNISDVKPVSVINNAQNERPGAFIRRGYFSEPIIWSDSDDEYDDDNEYDGQDPAPAYGLR